MQKSISRLLFAAILTISSITTNAEPVESQWWQLTLSYNATSVAVISAKPFDAPQKQVQTPGLDGAPLHLDYAATWQDSSNDELMQTTTTLPVGWRATLDSPGEHQTVIPENGIIVIRVKGPDQTQNPSALQLRRIGVRQRGIGEDKAPQSLQNPSLDLSIPPPSELLPPPGPVNSMKVRDTGPDSNRLVIAVLGDGYTAADLATGAFDVHTNTLLTAFSNKSPFNVYFNATNVYRLNVESNESGADEPAPGPGIFKDTYLNSSFWTGGTERLLAINSVGYARAIAAADDLIGVGIWDDIFVLVNSIKYGGSGGAIAVSSVHPASNEVIIHEYGHTFAKLADEYTYGGITPTNDNQPNVDFQADRASLKWNHWVEEFTPLPTPENSGYGDKVGAFLGAKYSTTGIYRPWENCVMRELGRPFCPVCKEATVMTYMSMLNFLEGHTPTSANSVQIAGRGVQFTVNSLPITPITYTWTLGGNVITEATTNQITITPAQLSGTQKTLTVDVSHPTPFVRKTEYEESLTWTLTPAPAAIPPEVWSLY